MECTEQREMIHIYANKQYNFLYENPCNISVFFFWDNRSSLFIKQISKLVTNFVLSTNNIIRLKIKLMGLKLDLLTKYQHIFS